MADDWTMTKPFPEFNNKRGVSITLVQILHLECGKGRAATKRSDSRLEIRYNNGIHQV